MEESYTDRDRNDDFQWFLSEYQNLYQKYGHKILAIRNRKVLGAYEDLDSTIRDCRKKYGLHIGEYLIQEDNGEENGFTKYIS